MMDTRHRLEEARKEFAEQLREPVPDRDSVLVKHEKISQLQPRLDSLVTEALLKEAQFLRPEERRKPGAWFPRRRGTNEGERR
jgi:Spy/CpxP family protein refolding chaperone